MHGDRAERLCGGQRDEFVVALDERGAQWLVPHHDRGDRTPQRDDVQRAVDPGQQRDVVEQRVRCQPVEPPHLLLAGRSHRRGHRWRRPGVCLLPQAGQHRGIVCDAA
ncbi:MAG TPA: hypothetical protein VEO01_17230 [Pseudonocardiaceae bacterium]|nr:hypothetical protein [Pseudonocardiaceae bacterium]